MGVQTCIFDLYGTLVDIHTDEDAPRLWEKMAAYYEERGAAYGPEALRGAYRRLVGEAERSAPGYAHEAHPEIRLELVFQRLFWDRGAQADLERAVRAGRRFRELSTEYCRLYPGARELLTDLRSRGLGVYLLSNAQGIFTRVELDRLDLTDCFDGICLSSECGVKKPDRRFFEILFQTYHLSPEGAVMVGNDGLCDIRGAQAAGLKTVYLRSNLSPAEPTPPADCVVERMDFARVGRILTKFDTR